MVILLGTHFMFNEELGSRLRGIGYKVYPFDSLDNLKERLDSHPVELVIFDLQHQPLGGLTGLQTLELSVPVLALCEHKETDTLKHARVSGYTVITNSQASKDIEGHVRSRLNE